MARTAANGLPPQPATRADAAQQARQLALTECAQLAELYARTHDSIECKWVANRIRMLMEPGITRAEPVMQT